MNWRQRPRSQLIVPEHCQYASTGATAPSANSELPDYEFVRAAVYGQAQERRANEALAAESDEHRELLEMADEEIEKKKCELDRLSDENDALRGKCQALERRLAVKQLAASSAGVVEDVRPKTVENVGEAIEAARAHLPYVVIPDEAVAKDVWDKTAWANDVWQRFQFLNEYAERSPSMNPYMWAKCGKSKFEYGGTHGLAMQESKTVKGWQMNSRHSLGGGKSRWFPVDPAVEPSGEVLMFAHFKFGRRSGGETLRIHFYDDAKRSGGTGKIHVGYIGTHLLTENTD